MLPPSVLVGLVKLHSSFSPRSSSNRVPIAHCDKRRPFMMPCHNKEGRRKASVPTVVMCLPQRASTTPRLCRICCCVCLKCVVLTASSSSASYMLGALSVSVSVSLSHSSSVQSLLGCTCTTVASALVTLCEAGGLLLNLRVRSRRGGGERGEERLLTQANGRCRKAFAKRLYEATNDVFRHYEGRTRSSANVILSTFLHDRRSWLILYKL